MKRWFEILSEKIAFFNVDNNIGGMRKTRFSVF